MYRLSPVMLVAYASALPFNSPEAAAMQQEQDTCDSLALTVGGVVQCCTVWNSRLWRSGCLHALVQLCLW